MLNIGDEQGVKQDGELLVSRDGKLVAKVVVRTVEKGRSIANIVPGWKLGEVIEGDEVSPAHPATCNEPRREMVFMVGLGCAARRIYRLFHR